jgi:hypothetical protein
MSNLRKYLWVPIVIAFPILQSQSKSISDSIQLSQYQPPLPVAQLAQATQMTEKGRRIFYLTKPQIEPKAVGLKACKQAGSNDSTNTLGCYVSTNRGKRGIYILEVTDQRLSGVMETTAAHEMLHAAYQELSNDEKENLNQQLLAAFDRVPDESLRKLVSIYRQRDPGVVNNELHSLLGTKIAELSPELEKHYQRYFIDRSAVVALSKNYEQAFIQFESKAGQMERQLRALQARIDQLENQAKEHRAALDQIGISDNSKRAEYNQKVDIYNQFVTEIKQQSQAYNQMLNNYNALSVEEKSLNNALTSGIP